MAFFENVYFTDFTVGSLIPACFLFLSSFFLLTIKGKSKASFHLGVAWGTFGIIPASYLFTSSIYHPSMSYLRWVNAVIAMVSAIHVLQFFFHFPDSKKEKLAKYFLYIGYSAFFIVWISFILLTLNAGKVYKFSGHFWDLDAENLQEKIAIFILAYVLFYIIAGIWRVIITKGEDKKFVIGVFISYLFGTIPVAVANILSREGIISRGTFIFVYDLFIVVSFFFVFVLYINHTKDKTSFLAKIIGISLVTFLLVLQVISNFSLNNKELAYDEIKKRDTILTINQGKFFPDQRYIIEYSIDQNRIQDYHLVHGIDMDFLSYQNQYVNSFLLSRISNLDNSNFKTSLNIILNETGRSFTGYRESIRKFLKTLPDDHADNKTKVIQYIKQLNLNIVPFRKKIESASNNNTKDVLLKICKTNKDYLIPFARTIEKFLNTTNLEGNELKKETLGYVAEIVSNDYRFYREDVTNNSHYVSYFYVDLNRNVVYEVGFDYLTYRKYVHATAYRFIVILFAVVLFVLFGFRLFFYGALVKPLNLLLDGLKAVNKGTLDIKLHVFVEDEIGYLTKSFNRMVRSIKGAKTRLQKYASELELKVEERTKELKETLEQVQKLKVQQDGDYYLTSLLIKPLGKNQNKSERVDIKFLVTQKKKFQFRTYQEEIGGDICVSYSITLRGKPYTVFLNGDAMGKSIQGAGGALVIGSVFRSIVERTNINISNQNLYPEKWLKNCFIELHKVFESFDGSMLISTVVGLIEDETGFMYYINAEHPLTMLYRDGLANFIEDDIMFHKLGTLDASGTIYVRTFQFEEGDVIIAGSDGRDDILLKTESNGARVINEDQTIILKRVEEGKGDLEQIYQKIIEHGELTDDLSLLRIEYKKQNITKVKYSTNKTQNLLKQSKIAYQKGDFQNVVQFLEEAYSLEPNNNQIIRYLINIYHKLKNYSKAEFYAEKYSSMRPWEIEYLYSLSYFNKKIGNLEKAAEFGERLRIRNPELDKNIANLVEVYYLMKNFERALMLMKDAIKIDPENKNLINLKKKIESAQNIAVSSSF
ncbi:MAG: SpoIIE family protein phosphatase [Leptospiraceae bacterium]|nr:SpoIIE family protein phosphatase [Leptospiraceae bacterium]